MADGDRAMAMKGDRHVLIVAGSDSSGGAGIARDIETVAACGLRSCLAVTAVTVQTHERVERIERVAPENVAAQMRAALAANDVAAIKIGMLGAGGAVEAVAAVLRDHAAVPVVLDPVIAASSGRALLPRDAVDLMRRQLMPLCILVTPNLVELAILTNEAPAGDEAAMERQARAVLDTGCAGVLAKGGHMSGTRATDILLRREQAARRFEAPRIAGSLRGTGCMLSSAIAACLARGEPMEASIGEAKAMVLERLARRHFPF